MAKHQFLHLNLYIHYYLNFSQLFKVLPKLIILTICAYFKGFKIKEIPKLSNRDLGQQSLLQIQFAKTRQVGKFLNSTRLYFEKGQSLNRAQFQKTTVFKTQGLQSRVLALVMNGYLGYVFNLKFFKFFILFHSVNHQLLLIVVVWLFVDADQVFDEKIFVLQILQPINRILAL